MWTLKVIKSYISDGIEENIHLDYKGSAAIGKAPGIKKEISKDISAFANSDGGVIFYGVREFDQKEKKHLPEKIDPIDCSEYSKEWLEQVINSTISPRFPNLIITPVKSGGLDSNDTIYVVEIPKSSTAHQAQDKRYYRRYNFQSIAMEDWEIKDIFNRAKHPKIIIECEIVKNSLNIYAKNEGKVYGKYINATVEIPERWRTLYDNSSYNKNVYKICKENTIRDILKVIAMPGSIRPQKDLGPSRYHPILPSQRFLLIDIPIERGEADFDEEIIWEVVCDNAGISNGIIKFRDIKAID
ncbi:MAG: ATP-binding protein [Bacteroidales bacterium]|nr:ATP-binding protein [Bacteroidales bacterium]